MSHGFIAVILLSLISLVVLIFTIKLKEGYKKIRIFPESKDYDDARILLSLVIIISALVLAPTIYFFSIMNVAWIFFFLTVITIPIFLIVYHYQGKVNKELHFFVGSAHILILSFIGFMILFGFASAFTGFHSLQRSPVVNLLVEIISHPTIFIALIVIGGVSLMGLLLSPPKPKHEY